MILASKLHQVAETLWFTGPLALLPNLILLAVAWRACRIRGVGLWPALGWVGLWPALGVAKLYSQWAAAPKNPKTVYQWLFWLTNLLSALFLLVAGVVAWA